MFLGATDARINMDFFFYADLKDYKFYLKRKNPPSDSRRGDFQSNPNPETESNKKFNTYRLIIYLINKENFYPVFQPTVHG